MLRICGGKPLHGTVVASGAKNSMSKLIIASLLSDKRCTFFNVPDVGDVGLTLAMCREVGMEYVWDRQARVLEVQTKELKTTYIPQRFSGSNRVPILMMGALLARSDEDIVVPVPSIETADFKPIDFHIEALKTLGATIELKSSRKEIAFHACAPQGLSGGVIQLPYPSMGATENSILAAVTARGTTIIRNAAVEPEIVELILFLQKLGAHIVLEADRTITVQGTRAFHPTEHQVMPDRTEAASFAMLALASGGKIFVEGARHDHLLSFLNAVREVGGAFSVRHNGIEFWTDQPLKGGLHLETDVHPGFMTDWQQPFVVMLTQAEGSSIVHETVYEHRLGYVDTLNSMGAQICTFNQCLGSRRCRFADHTHPHSAIVRGKTVLQGTHITIPDLRAGFSYVMAALLAEGESVVSGLDFLERGYERIVSKLQGLGADIAYLAPSPQERPEEPPDLFSTFACHIPQRVNTLKPW
jgi:UDP-N-acetylglucosamine 1-carboxyvinyltransferase